MLNGWVGEGEMERERLPGGINEGRNVFGELGTRFLGLWPPNEMARPEFDFVGLTADDMALLLLLTSVNRRSGGCEPVVFEFRPRLLTALFETRPRFKLPLLLCLLT